MSPLTIFRYAAVGLAATALLVGALWTPVSTAQEDTQVTNDRLELTFGVYTSDKASSIYKKVKPVLRDLETRLPTALGRPVVIRHKIFTSYDEAIDALVGGSVDFVRFGPASYVLAKSREPGIRLLAIEESQGKGDERRRFAGVIFTRKDSGIRTLADLRGKSFAFGDENSTIGRYLSQAELFDAGLHLGDLERHEYLGRHDRVASSVILGRFDAGAAKVGTYEKYRDKGLVEIHRFDNVTKPWVARARLDKALFDVLQQALIDTKDPLVLKALGSDIDGFGRVGDIEYDFVREGMERAEKFAAAASTPSSQPTVEPTIPAER